MAAATRPVRNLSPRQVAIVRANRYAVDHSDHLIAYVWHAGSNACNILEYAEKHFSLHITRLSRP